MSTACLFFVLLPFDCGWLAWAAFLLSFPLILFGEACADASADSSPSSARSRASTRAALTKSSKRHATAAATFLTLFLRSARDSSSPSFSITFSAPSSFFGFDFFVSTSFIKETETVNKEEGDGEKGGAPSHSQIRARRDVGTSAATSAAVRGAVINDGSIDADADAEVLVLSALDAEGVVCCCKEEEEGEEEEGRTTAPVDARSCGGGGGKWTALRDWILFATAVLYSVLLSTTAVAAAADGEEADDEDPSAPRLATAASAPLPSSMLVVG